MEYGDWRSWSLRAVQSLWRQLGGPLWNEEAAPQLYEKRRLPSRVLTACERVR